jgi:hypothetical protein
VFESSNSHYETDFGVSSPFGAGNTRIGFFKAYLRCAFKKTIFIMRIAGLRGISHFGDDIRRKIYISKRIR